MQTWPSFHQQGGHVRSCDHWQLLIAIRNRNCIFQSTHHSCVIHTSRIEFWWLRTWYCLSFHSYLALINYSHPLTNEIIGMFCRVSAWTPAFINRESSFISVWKTCCKMICGAVNRIFAYYRSLNCSQIIKKQRQECLTSDNNNSTIADLQQKNVAKTIMFDLLDLIRKLLSQIIIGVRITSIRWFGLMDELRYTVTVFKFAAI